MLVSMILVVKKTLLHWTILKIEDETLAISDFFKEVSDLAS